MVTMQEGDRLIPPGHDVTQYSITLNDGDIYIRLEIDDGSLIKITGRGVLTFRFTEEELYLGHLEGSSNNLVILKENPWNIFTFSPGDPRREYVLKRKSFHLNIPEVGVFEIFAMSVEHVSEYQGSN